MTKDAKELAAGVADKVLDEIESTRLWDDNNYVRGYVDGLARAMQIVKAEVEQMKEDRKDDKERSDKSAGNG